mmetsp:Transcript_30043/g.70833  ORF Transcript_30043/g.70833 Transcript_30043/m.70833 type:complete len:255 (-) Transcript_30043:1494-2258(-)
MAFLRNLLDDDDDDNIDNDLGYDNCKETEIVSASFPEGGSPLSYGHLCYAGTLDCAPGLILSDSEESMSTSCGAEEFFDLEELTSTLNLMENWQKLRRRVQFGSAHVREYAITVGDHPICRDGLALSLDWYHAKEKVYDIDDYELLIKQRENQRRGIRRRRRVSKLDYWQRREILNRIGSFSNADLARIECERNQEAVSQFLQEAGSGDFGPSLEFEDEGIELEQVYETVEYNPSPSINQDEALGWQMNVQILE